MNPSQVFAQTQVYKKLSKIGSGEPSDDLLLRLPEDETANKFGLVATKRDIEAWFG